MEILTTRSSLYYEFYCVDENTPGEIEERCFQIARNPDVDRIVESLPSIDDDDGPREQGAWRWFTNALYRFRAEGWYPAVSEQRFGRPGGLDAALYAAASRFVQGAATRIVWRMTTSAMLPHLRSIGLGPQTSRISTDLTGDTDPEIPLGQAGPASGIYNVTYTGPTGEVAGEAVVRAWEEVVANISVAAEAVAGLRSAFVGLGKQLGGSFASGISGQLGRDLRFLAELESRRNRRFISAEMSDALRWQDELQRSIRDPGKHRRPPSRARHIELTEDSNDD